ncbi:4'-phosphopantetheinyl transferase [Paraburkholderia unamae]|uniref:4'-phosphopantetheinyl transferase n=2 Tax=Paraburkholderia unamae TaxID=219649 RepID=A0ABX5KE66_9BURK|nr:4'-phosphopantetheinyl transferase [Paraburkholderia unamae]
MDFPGSTSYVAPSPASLSLPDSEVHVWYARTSACDTPELRARYASLLSPLEHERFSRFAFDHLKLEYLVTRALSRCVLSRYLGKNPGSLRFVAGTHGKPELEPGSDGHPPLRFNLSNTSTFVVCAVTRSADVGVDIERVDRSIDIASLANRCLAPEERRALRAVPAEQRSSRFFELWTLKEAWLKATGIGLSIEPDQVAFSISCGIASAVFGPDVDDLLSNWQFVTHKPEKSCITAVAIRTGTSGSFRVRFAETVPLQP